MATCSTCTQAVADAEVCTRLCQSEVPKKFWNNAFTGTADSTEPQYIGTSSATDDPPNFFYGDISASLLWQCLDTTRDIPINSAEALGECCEMDDGCKATLAEATRCQKENCLDPDLKTYTTEYFNCVSTGGCINPESGNDHGAFCLQFTLGTSTNPIDGSSGIQYVFDTLQETQQCSAVDPFIDGVCSVSDNCCPNCSVHMGAILDVVLNSVILNGTLTNNTNFTEFECPIGQTRCCPDGVCPTPPVFSRSNGGGRRALLRSLEQSTTGKGTTNLTTTTKQKERISNITDRCTSNLSRNMIAYNRTFAGSRYIECLQTNLAKELLKQEAQANTQPSGAPKTEGGGSGRSGAFLIRMAISTFLSVVGSSTILLFV
mmetsp:Transcript_15458/g.38476  ORF Transcript_15458/g.38476 Transcript_15458/m.38476 type:complete len:375 (+) Transcript_15458:71-1195(+)